MCLRILREDFEYLGREKNFTIIDDQEQISIIKEIFRFYKIDTKELTPKTVLRIVNDIKQKRMNPEYIKSKDGIEFYALDSNKNGLNSLRIFEEYEKRIINNNYLDFNDLLNYTAKLFELDEMKEK
jgi:DNA helicase-2/ATP-dependent DNA helicase PcrA